MKDFELENIDNDILYEYISLAFKKNAPIVIDEAWLNIILSTDNRKIPCDIIRFISSWDFIENIGEILMKNISHWQEFTLNKKTSIYIMPYNERDLEVFYDLIAWEQAHAIRTETLEGFIKEIINLIK